MAVSTGIVAKAMARTMTGMLMRKGNTGISLDEMVMY